MFFQTKQKKRTDGREGVICFFLVDFCFGLLYIVLFWFGLLYFGLFCFIQHHYSVSVVLFFVS